ncbi:MAG: hypothetical protein ACE5J7_01740 [Candidatus Aenigmatarchaeota archaeon]
MKIEIKQEKENPVLKRKEIRARIDYGGGATPSKAEMQVAIATEMKVAPEKVEISRIISDSGLPAGTIWAKIWEEKKVEIYTKAKEEKPAEEKPVEAPKEEAPKEEKPAEAPREAKPEAPKEEPKAEEKKEEEKKEGE